MSNIKTVGKLTVFKIIGGVLGIIYSIFQVRYFGTGRTIEVFFAAQAVVYMISSLAQSGQLSEVFLPEYLKIKLNSNNETAHRAFSVVINKMNVYLFLGLVVVFFLAPYIIRAFIPGFSISDQNQGVAFFRVFIPLIILQINNSFLNVVLNAEKIFGRIEVAAIINYLLSLLFLIILYNKLGIWVLVLGIYVGMLVQLIISIYFAKKLKIKYYPVWSIKEFNHKSFFKTIFSTYFYTGSTQVFNWAMTASISFLPQGTYAIFQYVQKLFSKINGIFVQPISVVFFTKYSELISTRHNPTELKNYFKTVQEISLLLGLLIFSFVIAGGKEGLSLLWLGDTFTIKDLDLSYRILLAFFFVFVFQIFHALNRKALVAAGFAKHNYFYQGCVQLISAVIYYVGIIFFGINGLILGIVLNGHLLSFVAFIVNYTKNRLFYDPPNSVFIFRFLGALVIAYSGFFYLKNQYFVYDTIGINRINDMLIMILSFVLSFVALTMVLIVLRIDLLSYVRSVLNKR